jgi:predicted membrane-bound spermidine synthase
MISFFDEIRTNSSLFLRIIAKFLASGYNCTYQTKVVCAKDWYTCLASKSDIPFQPDSCVRLATRAAFLMHQSIVVLFLLSQERSFYASGTNHN